VKEEIKTGLTPEKVKKARELIEKLKEKYEKAMEEKSRIQPVYDEHYFRALEYLDDEGPDLSGLKGILHFSENLFREEDE